MDLETIRKVSDLISGVFLESSYFVRLSEFLILLTTEYLQAQVSEPRELSR